MGIFQQMFISIGFYTNVMTKKLIVEIDDKLDNDFRDTLVKTKGFKKGVIKEAMEEALQAWIDKHNKKK